MCICAISDLRCYFDKYTICRTCSAGRRRGFIRKKSPIHYILMFVGFCNASAIYTPRISCGQVCIYVRYVHTMQQKVPTLRVTEIPTSNALKSFLQTPRSSAHMSKSLCWRRGNFRLWRRKGRKLPRREFHRKAICFRFSRGCAWKNVDMCCLGFFVTFEDPCVF